MSGGNTPGSATPDPKEAKEPPDFASHPQEAYDFVCWGHLSGPTPRVENWPTPRVVN